MKIFTYLVIMLVISCRTSTEAPDKKPKKKATTFNFKETLVKGLDTGIIRIDALPEKDIEKVLSQHWYLDDVSDASDDKLVWVNGNESRLFPEIILFEDSTAMVDPRVKMRTGKWNRELLNKINTLTISFDKGRKQEYRIRELSASMLKISWRDGKDSFWIRFHSDAIAHQNIMNDPFHPVNNKWRIKPAKKESDLQIHDRVKDCVRFYALYYRDAIKRKKKEILFSGLPDIFVWYNRGIGLPDRKLVEDSWIACFYNKEQALKGYDLLHKLIVDEEYTWPKGSPGWIYDTHSVLEQMYKRIDLIH